MTPTTRDMRPTTFGTDEPGGRGWRQPRKVVGNLLWCKGFVVVAVAQTRSLLGARCGGDGFILVNGGTA